MPQELEWVERGSSAALMAHTTHSFGENLSQLMTSPATRSTRTEVAGTIARMDGRRLPTLQPTKPKGGAVE